jgi:choline-glycine betaine transporter
MEEIIRLATALSGAPLSVLLIIALCVVVKWWRDDLATQKTERLAALARDDEHNQQYANLLKDSVAAITRVADTLS